MRLTSENISKLIRQSKDLGLLAFAISSKNKAIFKEVMLSLGFDITSLNKEIEFLDKEGFLSKSDRVFIEASLKSKKKIQKTFDDEILEIVDHLNKVSGKKFTKSNATTALIKRYLEKGSTVEDFKKVNLYFTIVWGRSADMKRFIRPVTLYNTKFPGRVEEAEEFFSEINKHQDGFVYIQKKFPLLVAQEMDIDQGVRQIEYKDRKMPFLMRMRISHWLEAGYSIEDLVNTIKITSEQWSKNPNLRPYISISKILDDKFPDRVKVVKSLISKGAFSNPNVEKINNWIKGGDK